MNKSFVNNIKPPYMKAKGMSIVWIRVILFVLISLYSKVVFGQENIPADQRVGQGTFKVYPTISSYDHRLDMVAEKSQVVVVRWIDISGRIMQTEELSLEKGSNSFSIRNSSRLGKGNYILSVVIDGKPHSGRIILM